MTKIFIFSTLLFSNYFYSQVINKTQIDDYINNFSKREFVEIHEGYLGNKPYSYSINRDENKVIVLIEEFIGGKKGSKNEFYFFDKKLIYIKNYKFNSKTKSEKLNCEIYPTLDSHSKGKKCKVDELIRHGNFMFQKN